MMRALWTAGLGMEAQQLNVDVISNNLSNVNTTAFKKDRVDFKDLLYENLNKAYNNNSDGKPVNLEVGHGVYAAATVKSYAGGNIQNTENNLDFAINGPGFFVVKGPQGVPNYTRDGSFKLSVGDEGTKIVTSDGSPLLDDSGNEIFLTVAPDKMNVSDSGDLSYTDENGQTQSMGQKIGIVNFTNPAGLESLGNNLVGVTSASGQPIAMADATEKSVIQQGFLETSNVQVVEEMVKLITAQRAYEINSKALQSADEMLQMANNLKK